jgi:fatty acid desaturase
LLSTRISEQTGQASQDKQPDHFPELRGIIKERGLLDRQPAYYTFKIISTLALLAVSIAVLVVVDNFWLQMANAAFLALVFGQLGYLGHDAGHRGITRSIRGNEMVSLGVIFLIGLSRSWWVTKHNQHHDTPNNLELDPHTLLPLMAFSPEAAVGKPPFLQRMVVHQAFYYPPLLLLEGLGIRLASAMFLSSPRQVKYPVVEPLLMVLHFAMYLGLLFTFLSPLQVLGFVTVHQALFGLYYGLIFAPNHKGMLIIDADNDMDFMRTQVLTTRNVKASVVTDFMYGGLNHQIEHHLFPSMPRNQLGEAGKIVKAFCETHGISYHETGTWRSYREILASLHAAGAPLRRPASSG